MHRIVLRRLAGVATVVLVQVWPIAAEADDKVLLANSQGNFAVFSGIRNFNVVAGNTITFSGLRRDDNIVEVNSDTLTASQLCDDATLPAGTAHPVIPQDPLPAGLYPANELSGPYRAYPYGIYAISVSSRDCGYVEKTTPCTGPGEEEVYSLPNRSGGIDYLCKLGRNSPSCVKGRVLNSTWSHPGIQGVFLRLDWKDVNPAYDVYDWAILDRELAMALKFGKHVTIGIRVGGDSIPDFVFGSGHPVHGPAHPVTLRDFGTGANNDPGETCGEDVTVASPSDAAFREMFKEVIVAMGRHVREDQRRFSVITGIKVTGMGMETLENRLPKRCNIAVQFGNDVPPSGHLVDIEHEGAYEIDPDFDDKLIPDVATCVCNPYELRRNGYTPDALYAFYDAVEDTIHRSFGYKQKVFMNISAGFPLVGNGGRFLGDHLYPKEAPEQEHKGTSPVDFPGGTEQTRTLIERGRNGRWTGAVDEATGRGFGVENASLDELPLDQGLANEEKCSQQRDIETSSRSPFFGSAMFPIPSGTPIDVDYVRETGRTCPNTMATVEGVSHGRVTGYQTSNDVLNGFKVDSALWNMTLNTNGLFIELYEFALWRAPKEATIWGVMNADPSVRHNLQLTPHGDAATTKSLMTWNDLLLNRAKNFSTDNTSLYQTNPIPSSYVVTIQPSDRHYRYFFNARACKAYRDNNYPVRINRVRVN